MLRTFHKQIGLIFGYISFWIFFTGTIGYYRDDITIFMSEYLYKFDYKNSDYINLGLDYFKDSKAEVIRISKPSSTNPYISLSWKDKISDKETKRNRKVAFLDPQTGKEIKLTPTSGGKFLTSLHYNLWYIDMRTGRTITCFLGIVMMFLFITGVVIHKRFIKDFFVIRKKIFYRDSHILVSICSFVVLFGVIFSGVYLTQRFVLQGIYAGNNTNSAPMIKTINEQKKSNTKSISNEKLQNNFLILDSKRIQNLIKYPENVSQIEIIKANKNTIKINYYKKYGKKMDVDYEIYSLKNYEFLKSGQNKKSIGQTMKSFHIGDLNSDFMRFLFFVFGAFGCFISISGVKISQKNMKSQKSKAIIQILNNTFITGAFCATGIYFLLNQINFLPLKDTDCFFISLVAIFAGSVFIKNFSLILKFITLFVYAVVVCFALYQGALHNKSAFTLVLILTFVGAIFVYLLFKERKIIKFKVKN